MNNGQGAASTETGAYEMSMPLPVRLDGAKVFLPSEAEWYKAAYYGPRSSSDGAVNTSDIEAFVLALIDPEMFTEQTGLDSLIGEINQDGVLNASDIDPFVDILANGSLEIATEATIMISQLPAADASFRIIHAAKLSNEIEIAWVSVPGRGYTVEFSEDLAPASWTPLNTIAIVAIKTSTLFKFSPVDVKVGYYRVTERNP